MIKGFDRKRQRLRRHLRLRKRVVGSAERPRLAVSRSLKHIYAQLIDDTAGRTLLAVSSLDKELRGKVDGGNVEGARMVGDLLAKRALAAGLKSVVFDRGGNAYHGRVQALAEAAREGGLEF